MNKKRISQICVGLVIIALGGLLFTSCSGSSNNTPAANKTPAKTEPTAAAKQTMPPNAPPGAEPPEQMGSPTASVTLEEFADYQCPSCAAAHPAINEIKSMYGSRIHFIFRNFPLKIAAHDKAYDAALAASAAGMQGKFWDMQNMLFSNQKTWSSDPTYKDIWKGYAQKVGLNVDKWLTDMAGMGAKNRVEADLARGNAVPINSTPSLFINGVAVPFSDMNVTALKTIIDAELQKTSGGNASAPAAKSEGSNSNK